MEQKIIRDGHLAIFERPIRVNTVLPKWKTLVEDKKTYDGMSEQQFRDMFSREIGNLNVYISSTTLNRMTRNTTFPSNDQSISNTFTLKGNSSKSDERTSIFKKIGKVFGFNRWIENQKVDQEPVEQYEFNAIEFFSNVKNLSKDGGNVYVNRIANYLKALSDAENVGQTALAEHLKRNLILNKYESVLYAAGYYHVVTEEQVVQFASKTEKGLALDYIENFIRPIPKEVIAAKNEADKLEVFDNYVVLHYDPDNTGVAKTEAEKEEELRKKADPILFGVIADSKKLYYITDWIDSKCDLTLEEFVDTLEISKDDLKMATEIIDDEISAE